MADLPTATLHLSEADVERLLSPAEAVEAIEACFRRMAAGSVENRPRCRLRLEHGALAVMAAADLELGYAGAKVYAGFAEGARFVVTLFRTGSPQLVAVIDADSWGSCEQERRAESPRCSSRSRVQRRSA